MIPNSLKLNLTAGIFGFFCFIFYFIGIREIGDLGWLFVFIQVGSLFIKDGKEVKL